MLNFCLAIPPGCTSFYKRSEDVMVDRAEIGVEWQKLYDPYCSNLGTIHTDWFGEQLYNNIGGEPGLVWFKNFDCNNLDSHPTHWKPPYDSAYTDSVDMTSWSGHSWYATNLHFFTDSSCIFLPRANIDLGDTDAEWVIFDTCGFLKGSEQDLKDDLLTSGRCAHMFLGFVNGAHWDHEDNGEYFTIRLKETTIKEAWYYYCRYKQRVGTTVRVFEADYCMDESLKGPGPREVKRDPTSSSTWIYEDYTRPR